MTPTDSTPVQSLQSSEASQLKRPEEEALPDNDSPCVTVVTQTDEQISNSNQTSSMTDVAAPPLRIRNPERLKSIRILRYNETKEEESNMWFMLRKNPLNGGYKYITLLLTFLTLFAFSISLCMSLLTSSFEVAFNATRGKTSLFSSIEYGVFCLFSIPIPMIMGLMDSRLFLTIFFASLCIGLFVPSFFNNFDGVIAFYAIFVGPAASALQYFGIAANAEYFDQLGLTGTAVGIALSSIGAGGIAFTYYILHFIGDDFNWRVPLRMSALIVMCIGIFVIAVYCPRTHYPALSKKKVQETVKQTVDSLAMSEQSASLAVEHAKGSTLFQLADFSMLLFPRFSIFTAATILGTFMFYAPYVHLIPHAIDKGLSEADASFLLVIVGIGNIVTRPLMGTVVDKLSARMVYFISLLLLTGTCTAWIFAESKAFFYTLSAFLGVALACYIVAVSCVPFELLPVHRAGSGVGFSLGLSFFTGACFAGPIMGAFRDADGHYQNVLILFSVFSGVAALLGGYLVFTPNVIPDHPGAKSATETSASNDIQMVESGNADGEKAVSSDAAPQADSPSTDTSGNGTMYLTEDEMKRVVEDFCVFHKPWYEQGCPSSV